MRQLLYSIIVFALFLAIIPIFGQDGDELLFNLPAFPAAKSDSTIKELNYGARLLAEGKSFLAEEVLGKALVANPKSAETAYNFGLALAFNGKYPEALQANFKALELQPTFVEAHLAIGVIFLTRGDNEEALKAFATVIEQAPDSESAKKALFNKGVILGRLKRYTEAELCLSEALAQTPDDSAPAFEIGKLKMKQEKWDEALKWLEAAAIAFPMEVEILRGKIYLKSNRVGDAENALKNASDLLAKSNIAEDIRPQIASTIQVLKMELTKEPSSK